MTFEQWWDKEANTPAPNSFKNWEESCRQAYAQGQRDMREAAWWAVREETEFTREQREDTDTGSYRCIEAIRALPIEEVK